jgi:hypothetical protein
MRLEKEDRHARRRIPTLAGALGLIGSAACSAAMLLSLAGLAGAGAVGAGEAGGGMPGMTGEPSSSPLGSLVAFLVQAGPAILIASAVVMLLASVLARRRALFPVAAGGLALYWGMYLQPNRSVMNLAIAVGLAVWVIAFGWTVTGRRTPTRR